MGTFWDERAREDAYFFVDNRLVYGRTDAERFWRAGESDLDRFLGSLGASIRPSDTVVEVGCGVGRLTRVIAERADRVEAIDVSAEMLAIARREHRGLHNVRWLQGDGTSLAGIEDASADACVSYVVFQHIPDPAVTLGYVREMGRVLRPGGWAAFQVSNDPAVHRPPSRITRARRRALAALGRFPRGQSAAPWLGSSVEVSALRTAASDGGMGIDRVVGEGTQFCLVLARRRLEG
jgi:SAM-dependent methyltransferase